MKTNPNDPAFPISYETDVQGLKVKHNYEGITKREIFAGMAMVGLISNYAGELTKETTANNALLYADALIEKLNEGVDKKEK